MVDKTHGNSGRFLNKDYHETRREAREETYTIDEWGPIDIERYDLETVDFDRKQKRSSYITEARIDAEGASKSGRDWSRDDIAGRE